VLRQYPQQVHMHVVHDPDNKASQLHCSILQISCDIPVASPPQPGPAGSSFK